MTKESAKNTSQRPPKDEINLSQVCQDLKSRISISSLFQSHGIALEKTPRGDFKCLCPFHDDTKPSMYVYDDHYHCYAGSCGAHGDIFDFMTELEGKTFSEAVFILSGGEIKLSRKIGDLSKADADRRRNLRPVEPKKKLHLVVQQPAPADAIPILRPKAIPFEQRSRGKLWTTKILNPGNKEEKSQIVSWPCTVVYTYRDYEGQIVGHVIRNEWMSDGKKRKSTLPVVWGCEVEMQNGEIRSGWVTAAFPEPRMPYGAERVRASEHAACVWFEGEKAVDAGMSLLPAEELIALGWIGGSNNVEKLEIGPDLIGRRHYLCADNDSAGQEAMRKLSEMLIAAGVGIGDILYVVPPADVPEKWDIADCTEWTAADAINWIHTHQEVAAVFFRKEDMLKTEVAMNEAASVSSMPVSTTDEEPICNGMENILADLGIQAGDASPQADAAESKPATSFTDSEFPENEALYRRVVEQGVDILTEPTALCVLNSLRKTNRDSYRPLKRALEALGADMDALEKISYLAVQGLNREGILIYRRVQLEGAAVLVNDDVLEMLVHMRSAERASYNALKKALRGCGVESQALERSVVSKKAEVDRANEAAGGGDEDGDGGDALEGNDDHIREVFDSAGTVVRALGHSKGIYFYQSSKTCEVVEIKADHHTKSAVLLQLANIDVWEACFPAATDNGGANWVNAADWLMESCHRAGIFDSSKIRGLGAWYDRGRSILHLGNRLIIDGVETKLQDYQGEFIYERGRIIPAPALNDPLSDEEGNALLAIFKSLRWSDPMGGIMMAGWVCSAMICGAMSWRPHAWLTGSSGSGKSWVQSNVINPLMEGIALFVQSATTEAGLRHSLNADALPVIFDEAEAEDAKAAARMQAIFELARQASSESGGQIRKGSAGGTAKIYSIRSSFLFSSIVVSLKQQADVNRFVVLNLSSPPAESDIVGREIADKSFADLKQAVHDTIQSDTSSRLFARLIKLIPTIVESVGIFARAAATALGSQRLGDQYGSLFAAAYVLSHREAATETVALEWINEHMASLTELSTDARRADHDSALQILMGYQTKVDQVDKTLGEIAEDILYRVVNPVGSPDVTVRDINDKNYGGKDRKDFANSLRDELRRNEDHNILRRHGLQLLWPENKEGKDPFSEPMLYISNDNMGLKRIFEGSPWGANWKDQFGRISVARKTTTPYRVWPGNNNQQRGTLIPISYLGLGQFSSSSPEQSDTPAGEAGQAASASQEPNESELTAQELEILAEISSARNVAEIPFEGLDIDDAGFDPDLDGWNASSAAAE